MIVVCFCQKLNMVHVGDFKSVQNMTSMLGKDLADSADEEYDDLQSGEEASMSEDGDSYTNPDSLSEEDIVRNENSKSEDVVYGNFGWADAMSKVLNASKPKKKKSVILAKAKKDMDALKTASAKEDLLQSFEIDSTVKQEPKLTPEEAALQRKTLHQEKLLRRQRRKEWDLVGRVLPSITQDREREKTLAKIGTRGVVQLFNSVKVQQKTIRDKLREAGPLERKREKALKSLNKADFLDLLQGSKTNSNLKVKSEPSSVKEEATWSVLRDDFMPHVTMRDWDKQDSSDSE